VALSEFKVRHPAASDEQAVSDKKSRLQNIIIS
jgi:hypothetical protein